MPKTKMAQKIKVQELLVIVGMPGAGKTTLVKQLLAEQKIDAFCDDYEFGPIRRQNPEWRESDHALIDGLRRGEKWAIADTRYCDPRERALLKKTLQQIVPGLKIKFVYFANEPELCEHNAEHREGKLPRHQINLIYYYTNLYKIPAKAEVIKIKSA